MSDTEAAPSYGSAGTPYRGTEAAWDFEAPGNTPTMVDATGHPVHTDEELPERLRSVPPPREHETQ